MKTMINLLLNGNLMAALQDMLDTSRPSKQLIFQPAASYWEMNPAERLAGMVRK